MPGLLKIFKKSASFAVIAMITCTCFAARDPRGTSAAATMNGRGTTNPARLPSIPFTTGTAIGIHAINPNAAPGGGTVVPYPQCSDPAHMNANCVCTASGAFVNANGMCQCQNGGNIDNNCIFNPGCTDPEHMTSTCACKVSSAFVNANGMCECPNGGDINNNCIVASTCADGGPENSSYTVDSCMNDIYYCVNNGGLPNGINSMFNEDLRNSIVNGMGLCLSQVETCVKTVRQNCQYVYPSASDVWLDFNIRKVQPEYYSFVLAQTGLTPAQAENTCLLLDRNTYGVSFDAVAGDKTTSEYNNQVYAYNNNKAKKTKDNPMGVKVNTNGEVDADRGHYARWDAEKAQCLLRVAAYNKNKLITHQILGLGDDTPAEVWAPAGSTFTCNKDLFDMKTLMRKTVGTAVLAVPLGTVAGAGIGVAVGHGEKDFDCNDDASRATLLKQLKEKGKISTLNMFLDDKTLSAASTSLSTGQCKKIVELYDLYTSGQTLIDSCMVTLKQAGYTETTTISKGKIHININCSDGQTCDKTDELTTKLTDALKKILPEDKTPSENDIANVRENCLFKDPNKAITNGKYLCDTGKQCIDEFAFSQRIDTLGQIFNGINVIKAQESNRLKTGLIGAGVGAATGGLATAIVALVEKNNIHCHVADGLSMVEFNKTHTIDKLRDIYVKWALRLPKTYAPTAVVTNCENWTLACGLYDIDECPNVTINYRHGQVFSTVNVTNACKVVGSECIINKEVANQNGVCLVNPGPLPNPNPLPNPDPLPGPTPNTPADI